jgi:hypothetical protein
MNLQQRIDLLVQLGEYMVSDNENWQEAKIRAEQENTWFTQDFIQLAANNIAQHFLQRNKLNDWAAHYNLPQENAHPKNLGIVMAGNIPMVGFHDLLCAFLSGHYCTLKASSKDEALMKHLVQFMYAQEVTIQNYIGFADSLKSCNAYIATGSNNSSRYFEHYFSKYPHIIRRNRTSVAILDGTETRDELEKLADDVCLFYGLGCRNVTKLFVPTCYDFLPVLDVLNRYAFFADNNKYKNNYDYQLTLLILNNVQYMNNGTTLLSENESPFSTISHLHYQHYADKQTLVNSLQGNEDLQAIVGKGFIPFGAAQSPTLFDYADGVDTMAFLQGLN